MVCGIWLLAISHENIPETRGTSCRLEDCRAHEGVQGGVWDPGDGLLRGEKGKRKQFPVLCVLFSPSIWGLIHLFSTLFTTVGTP